MLSFHNPNLKGLPRDVAHLVKLVQRQDTHGNDAILQALREIGKTLSPFECALQIAVPLGKILQDIRDNPVYNANETVWFGWNTFSEVASIDNAVGRNNHLRESILETLHEINWHPDQSHIAAEYWVWRGDWNACVELGTTAIDPLLAAFKGQDETVRQQAYKALVEIGAPASEQLVTALRDEKADMREAGYRALVKIGSAAIPELLEALNDEYPQIRRCAIEGLGEIGDGVAINAIIPHLGDVDVDVQRVARHIIVGFGEQAIESLCSALKDDCSEVRLGAAFLLEELGWQPPDEVTNAMCCIIRRQWVRCLEIGEPAVQPLLSELSHWDKQVRRQALIILIKMDSVAVKPLVDTLISASLETQKSVVRDLIVVGGVQATYVLKKIREVCEDEDIQTLLDSKLQQTDVSHSNQDQSTPRYTINKKPQTMDSTTPFSGLDVSQIIPMVQQVA